MNELPQPGKLKRLFATVKDAGTEWVRAKFGGATGEDAESESGRLLHVGDGDFLTETNVFEGVQIFGATGSGKTSGSGQCLALSLLEAGFGGLVLTAKPEELKTWKEYLHHVSPSRLDDLCVLEPDGKYVFNFLAYEAEVAEREGINLTDNLVALFCTVMETAQRGGSQDAYWLRTLKQLLRNAIDLVLYAGEKLNFQNLHNLITSAPTHISYVINKNDESCNQWREKSFCWQCGAAAFKRIPTSDRRNEDLVITMRYWMNEFPNLAEETRSIIVSYFTSMADCFLRGTLRDLFSPSETDKRPELRPDSTHKGKIIVLNLPVKEFNELGQFAQVLYKFVWQRTTERRNPDAEGQVPVFLWADEAQFFVTSHDMMFQTTARAKKAATVYLTQNISNYYAILPGEKGRAETDSLLGNFQTKIFHTNGDSVTNVWAADLIGKNWNIRENHSSSVSNRDGSGTSQFGISGAQTFEYQVIPMNFTILTKGGRDNDLKVQAYLFHAGRKWASGENFKLVTFKQERIPELPREVPAANKQL